MDSTSPEKLARMSKVEREIYEHKHDFARQWKIEEVCKFLNNRRDKPLLCRNEVKIRSEGRDMTLSRKLGHKLDLPMSGQWRLTTTGEQDSCWVCDNWQYTLLFWNREIGDFNLINSIGVEDRVMADVIQQIRMHNEESYLQHGDLPLFFSNVTDWRPKPFMPLLEFLNNLEYQDIPMQRFEEEAIRVAKAEHKFEDFNLLGDSKLQRVNKTIKETLDKLVQDHKREIVKRTPDIVKRRLRYKEP